jgi:hypothetical protein
LAQPAPVVSLKAQPRGQTRAYQGPFSTQDGVETLLKAVVWDEARFTLSVEMI